MKNDDIVTFGKYKNQPIEVLLNDEPYAKWASEQDFIRNEKYIWIYNAIKNIIKSEDTLEHNKMQIKFLNEEYRIRVAFLVYGQDLMNNCIIDIKNDFNKIIVSTI